jgi:hypothetical protein
MGGHLPSRLRHPSKRTLKHRPTSFGRSFHAHDFFCLPGTFVILFKAYPACAPYGALMTYVSRSYASVNVSFFWVSHEIWIIDFRSNCKKVT